MGACVSSSGGNQEENREQKERSFAIDKQIDDDAKKFRRECKILLLGTLNSISEILIHFRFQLGRERMTGSGELR